MEPLADAVGLQWRSLLFSMLNIIYRQMKLVIMRLHFAAKLSVSVGQYPHQQQPLRLMKWQHTLIHTVISVSVT